MKRTVALSVTLSFALSLAGFAHSAHTATAHTTTTVCWTERNSEQPNGVEGICGSPAQIPPQYFLHMGLPQ